MTAVFYFDEAIEKKRLEDFFKLPTFSDFWESAEGPDLPRKTLIPGELDGYSAVDKEGNSWCLIFINGEAHRIKKVLP